MNYTSKNVEGRLKDLQQLNDIDPEVVLAALPVNGDAGGVIRNIFQTSVPLKLENQLYALNTIHHITWRG